MHANDGGGAVTFNALDRRSRRGRARDYPTGAVLPRRRHARTCRITCAARSRTRARSACRATAAPAAVGGARFGGGGRGAAAAAASTAPGGAEAGYIAPDPTDPDIFYAGAQQRRRSSRSSTAAPARSREVSPYPRMFSGEPSSALEERWQWTYPIIFSPVDPHVALHRVAARLEDDQRRHRPGTRISRDLTRHDPKTMGPSGGPITRDMNGPEVYAVDLRARAGEADDNVIWTGSDDGLIHVTRTAARPGRTSRRRTCRTSAACSLIDAGAFDAGTAYVAVKRSLLDDKSPYIFRTHDFGKTWTKIVNGIAPNDYVHAVREDPDAQGPALRRHAARRLHLVRRRRPLAVAAAQPARHPGVGPDRRGRRPRDRDARPRASTSSTTSSRCASTAPADGRHRRRSCSAPAPAIRGATQPATIQYLLQAAGAERADRSARREGRCSCARIRRYRRTPADAGRGGGALAAVAAAAAARRRRRAPRKGRGHQHASTWDLRYAPAVSFPGMILWGGRRPARGGAGHVHGAPHRRRPVADPAARREAPSAARGDRRRPARRSSALAIAIRDKVSEANTAVIQIRDLKKQVADRLGKSSDADAQVAGDSLTAKLSAVEEEIYQVKNQSGQDPLNFPIKINNRLASLLGVVDARRRAADRATPRRSSAT